jgi:hypothetical protein
MKKYEPGLELNLIKTTALSLGVSDEIIFSICSIKMVEFSDEVGVFIKENSK